MIVSKIEIKLQFPYIVPFRYSMGIAQQHMAIYNTTVHKNKINVALNLMWLVNYWVFMKTPTGHKGGSQNVIYLTVAYDLLLCKHFHISCVFYLL